MRKSLLFPIVGLALSGCPGGGPEKLNPTFHKDIAPILNANCVSCHQTGQIAPFTLTSFADAFEHGAEMQIQTEARLMPPWHIEDGGDCQSYLDSRLLTDEQIETIRVWFDNGMPEGNPADAPPPPPPPPTIDRIDAALDMNVDYLPDETITDDYRCFLVDPGLTVDKLMTAYEVLPGTPEIVHHIILFSINSDQAQLEAESLDGADGRPGYTCFGDAGVDANPVIAWAPGINFQEIPRGLGVRLPANRKLAMQVHYNIQAVKPGQEIPTDRTSVNLKLEDENNAAETILLLSAFDFTLPPGLEEAEASTSTSLDILPIPVRIQGVLPHMHTRGQTLRFEVLRNGDPADTECLTNVPDWDFNWQQTYFYEDPITVSPQDVVNIRCTYDTSEETTPISFGEGTGDEMCVLGLYLSL
jgi:hypothetical protein